MTVVGLIIIGLIVYMVMRRRGRVFLEPDEAILISAFSVLAILQRLITGSVNLNDHFITPIYFALPVIVGHARGAARGLTGAILGGAMICILAMCFTPGATLPPSILFPGQYVVLVVLLGLTSAAAGLRVLPKAIKPLFSASWLILVAAYHPEYLESVGAYVIAFTSVTLSALGLYFNPFKPPAVAQIQYPVSPSRRD
jgi:hypothetical protein